MASRGEILSNGNGTCGGATILARSNPLSATRPYEFCLYRPPYRTLAQSARCLNAAPRIGEARGRRCFVLQGIHKHQTCFKQIPPQACKAAGKGAGAGDQISQAAERSSPLGQAPRHLARRPSSSWPSLFGSLSRASDRPRVPGSQNRVWGRGRGHTLIGWSAYPPGGDCVTTRNMSKCDICSTAKPNI